MSKDGQEYSAVADFGEMGVLGGVGKGVLRG